ncbi:MAG: hypothetical protein U1F77_13750 [Kiritimatiellia bacterium]
MALKVNGEAIYAGRSPFGVEFGAFSPVKKDGKGKPVFEPRQDWRCTTRPGKIYLHLFNWPATGKLELPAVKDGVVKAYLLADRANRLSVTQADDKLTIALPAQAPDPIASVICLETKSPTP